MNLTDLFILHQRPAFVNTFFEISYILRLRNCGADERCGSAPRDVQSPAAAVRKTAALRGLLWRRSHVLPTVAVEGRSGMRCRILRIKLSAGSDSAASS